MSTPGRSAGLAFRRRAARLALIASLMAPLGCAAPAPLEIPAELPLVTNDQLFEFRWALEREAARTRAVGRVRASSNTEFRLTLALFGVDAQGRVASRGTAYVRSDFSRETAPFAVEVTPVGGETRYELRVIDYYLTGIRPD